MPANYPLTHPAAPPRVISESRPLYLKVRLSTAMAGALCKMSQLALDEGEFPADDLDNLTALTHHLYTELEEIKAQLADASTGGRHE